MKKQKIDWLSVAKFLDSDYTLEFIPDIIYPTDTQVRNSKIKWLAEKLETGYKDFEPPEEDSEPSPVDEE